MKISNLEKIIDGRTIVEAINFEIQQDEIVGLVGRNGSGKTTIFRTLAGNYLPDNGDIEIDGTSLLSDESKNQSSFISMRVTTFYGLTLCKKSTPSTG